MVKLVKQLKLSLGAGTLGMAALFAASTYAFTSAFKSGIAGNEQLAFNIVIFPVLIGFLLAGYYQLVSRKFNSLMALAKKNEDADLNKYLDNIAIIQRLPILLSVVVLLLSGLLVFTQTSMVMGLSSMYVMLYGLGQSAAILIVCVAVRRSLASYPIR